MLFGWDSLKRFRIRYLIFATLFCILLFYYRQFVASGRMNLFSFAALLVVCAALIAFRRTRYAAAATVALTVVLNACALWYDERGLVQSDLIVWPLLGYLAGLPRSQLRLSIVLSAVTGVVILYLNYSPPFPFIALIAIVGLVLGVRNRRIRKDAYELNERRLAELDRAYSDLSHAHEELQLAQIDSMRYAALAERTTIARDIHDGLGHHLTSLIVQLQAVELMLHQGQKAEAAASVREALTQSREAMKEVRRAVREWSDDESMLGLAALKGLVSRTEMRSSLRIEWIQEETLSDWPLRTSVALYRVLQESLTNVLKHAGAERVAVRIREQEGSVVLTVSDDGVFARDPATSPPRPGFGWTGMAERCREAGGRCEFRPNSPCGLVVEATLPLATSILSTTKE